MEVWLAMSDPRIKYRVEHEYIYGWDDAGWTQDGKQSTFSTHQEAQDEIDDFCAETQREEGIGSYYPEEYRIVMFILEEKKMSTETKLGWLFVFLCILSLTVAWYLTATQPVATPVYEYFGRVVNL